MGERQVLAGRYQLEDVLGRGGMSEVWRAFDLVLSRWVAVKLLSSTYAHNNHFREAIRTEAQTAAKVSHPHLAAVYDYGESVDEADEPVPYVVMELLTGPTLAQRLADRPLPPHKALRICAEIADGLTVAHTHGLVHRDVKPSNIVLTSTGAKLIDFGVATTAGAPETSSPDGDIMGTPSYVAPERLLAGTALPASDVYSLGAVLFRALTGELPWPGGTPTDTSRIHPAALPDLDGVPPQIGQLYLRCVDLDPDRRPAAHQVAATLAAAAGIRPAFADANDDEDADETPEALVPPTPDPHATDDIAPPADSPLRRHRAAPIFVAVAATAVAGVIAIGSTHGSGVAPPETDPDAPIVAAPGITSTPPNPPDHQPKPTDGAPPGGPATTAAWPPATAPPSPSLVPGGAGGPTTSTNQPPPATTAGPGMHTFTSPGGSTVATCSGPLAYLESWSPAHGYSVPQPPRRGPDTTVWITFRKRNSDSTITVWCSSGQPEGQVSTVHTTKTPKSTPPARATSPNQHATARRHLATVRPALPRKADKARSARRSPASTVNAA